MAERPKKPKKQPPKPTTYSWALEGNTMNCFTHPNADQKITTQLWEAGHSEFHDDALQDATQQINEIIERVERENTDPDRYVSFIEFQSRLMLVWARYGAVSAYDAETEIAEALKLKDFEESEP